MMKNMIIGFALLISTQAFAAPNFIGLDRVMDTLATMNDERTEGTRVELTESKELTAKTQSMLYTVHLLDINGKAYDKVIYNVLIENMQVKSIQVVK